VGRAILRHWELKLLAVVIAFALWVFVVGGDRSRMAIAAPIEYVGLGTDVVLVSDTREQVDVFLEVARWATGRVTPDSVRVRVNLAGLREGENLVALAPSDVLVPPGVVVTRIVPPRLRVAVAGAAEERLEVVPQIRGVPADGFDAMRVLVDPPAVQVKGPRSTIEGRTTVETAPVDISGRRGDLVQTVGLMLPEYVYPTRGGSVQVTVEIRRDDQAAGPSRGARR
jgi:YbbR domain-containing protein